MKNLKKLLAIILSIAMVMCSTLPSVASEIEVIDETTKSKIEEQLREDLGEERANEILNVGAKLGDPEEEEETTVADEETSSVEANADDVGAKLGESEEEEEEITSVGANVHGALPEEEETTSVGANACGALPEEEEESEYEETESVEENETTVADEETTVATISEPEEIVISIASKSITDKTLYGADEPWMYWYLTDEDGDSTKETIHFSSTDPGGATGINCGPNDAIAYVGLGKDHITKAVFDNEINAVTCKHFFFDFKYLTNIENLNKLETGNVTSMNSMFFNCLYLSSIDLSKFNTGNVEDMFAMFAHMELSIKELDLKSFNTENVTDMGGMFIHCNVLEKILVSTKFNTTKVVKSENMFTNCTNLVGGAGTTYDGGHTDLEYARIDRPSLGEPGYFTRAPWMYWYLTYSGSEIHFSSTDPGGANPISSEIEVDYPTGLAKSNISRAVFDNEINAVTCKGLFAGFTWLGTIYQSGNLKTNNVKDMTNMFYNCQRLNHLTLSWDTSNVEDMTNMFGNCQSLNALGLYNFDTSKVKKMDKMFENCEYFDSVNLSNFDTSSVTTMASMFKNCKILDNLILSSKFTTAEVTDMESMFESCERLNNPDLSSFNTSKVTNMKSMFKDCTGLVKLDLTGFNTSNVELMEKMFYGCSSLMTIMASDEFRTTKVSDDGADMFSGCVNLVGGAGTTYDGGHTDKEYARIDGGPTSATPGYFTLYVPPTPPAPTPTYPQNYSSDRDGGGGGGGPLVDVIVPAVTYLPIVKNILALVNNTTSKWTKDDVTNKHKLNIINQNGTETPATLGFYNYTNVVTHIVNNVPVQTQTNDTYVFDDKGNMITGWVRTADGKWYLFEYEKTTNEGKMVIGWKKVQGSWYYFGTDGAMLTNAYTPDGHYVGPDGKWNGIN